MRNEIDDDGQLPRLLHLHNIPSKQGLRLSLWCENDDKLRLV